MDDRRHIMRRFIQGGCYASALGLFLLAVQVYLWPPEGECGTEWLCLPAYAWPVLGMVFSGAMASSAKSLTGEDSRS